MNNLKKKLIGDRNFYRKVLMVTVPIMIQNGITNFVNMLDNIMIGAVGTTEMTGVAVANQLIFVFNLCVFGAVSGAGVFGAQFFGKGDDEGVRHTFRFKVIFSTLITVACIALLFFKGDSLVGLYMQGDGGVTDPLLTMKHAGEYMRLMLVGLLPYAVVQCYSSTLREGGDPVPPMVAGVIAVFVNLVLNYVLIFGKFGAPALGVRGAAIATVISRFVELFIVVVWVHTRKKRFFYLVGAFRSLYVPRELVARLFIKGLPLMLNETLWAAGCAVVNQMYSLRGLDAVAAGQISQTFWNVVSISYMAVGSAIGIIIGQALGASKLEEARDSAYKSIAFSVMIATAVAAVYALAAEFIPLAYNTEPEIRHLATRMMQITAIVMPFEALVHSSYFTLRSGGKMSLTFVFDCGFMWGGNVLTAFILCRFTSLPFLTVFLTVQLITLVKSAIGACLVMRGSWVRNIINK